jgi:hypothetical protein
LYVRLYRLCGAFVEEKLGPGVSPNRTRKMGLAVHAIMMSAMSCHTAVPRMLGLLGGPPAKIFLGPKFLRLTTCMGSYRSVLKDPGFSEGKISSIQSCMKPYRL